MATLATLTANLATLVATPMDATGVTWSELVEALTTDFRIPAGEARVQIIASLASQNNTGDANTNYLEADAIIKIAYYATTGSLQTAWMDTHLHNLLATILAKSGWRALAAVHDLEGGPEAGIPEKIGKVIAVEVAARVQLAP